MFGCLASSHCGDNGKAAAKAKSSDAEPMLLSGDQLPLAIPTILAIGQAHFTSQCIYTIVKLGIPDIIGNGKRTVEEMSGHLSETVNKDYLQRCMRLLSLAGIFEEFGGPDGEFMFGLTPAGALLQTKASQPSVASGMLHWMEKPMWNAWSELSDAVAGTGPHQIPFNAANSMPVFDYYAQHSQSAEHLNEFMSFFSPGELPFVLEHAQWETLSGKTVVDVGGSLGDVMSAVAEKFSDVKCVSFDLPDVIEKVENPPAGVQMEKGDMFDASTIPTCDAIFMKHILHEWNDEDSDRILRSCYAALSAAGRVIIADAILPEAGHISTKDAPSLYLDILMLLIGGKERTRKMWDELVAKAGFKVVEEKQTGHASCHLLVLEKLSSPVQQSGEQDGHALGLPAVARPSIKEQL